MATLIDVTGFPALSPEDLAEIPTKTYKLSRAVVCQGETFDTLTMREPVVDDSLWVQGMKEEVGTAVEVLALARLCAVEPPVIRLLPAADYNKMQQDIMGFFIL